MVVLTVLGGSSGPTCRCLANSMSLNKLASRMAEAGLALTSLYESIDPLFVAAEVGIWQVDLATNQVWWSTKTRQFHGVEGDETISLDMAVAFYRHEDRRRVKATLKNAVEQGQPWVDLRGTIITRQGKEVLLRSAGVCLKEGEQPRWLLGLCFDVTEQTALARELETLASVVRQMSSAAILCDKEGRAIWTNQAFTDQTGYALADVAGRRPGEVLQGIDTDRATRAAIGQALREGRNFRGEILNYHRSGKPYWIDLTITPVREPSGEIIGFVSVQTDCSERRLAQLDARNELDSRRRTETLLRDILDAVPSYIFAFDENDRLLLVSEMVREHFPQYGASLFPGMTMEEVVRLWLNNPEVESMQGSNVSDEIVQERLGMIRAGLQSRERRLADGRWLLSWTRKSSSGNLIWARADITALKMAQLEAAELARRDPLTGLLNRTAFMAVLKERKQAVRKEAASAFGCIAVLDIDHFKSVNDAYGHDAGDALIQTITRRMQENARPTDVLARLGGDEFALFLEANNEQEAHSRASSLLMACMQEAAIDSFHMLPSVSIGAAVPSQPEQDCEELLRHADRALFEAKRSGRSRVVFYSSELARELTEKHHLAQQLRKALIAGRPTIALQAQFSLRDHQIIGFEALARWQEGGQMVEPAKFVAAAEEHGLADQLGSYVLEKALAAISQIRKETGLPIRVAINISNAQILADDFEENIRSALDAAGLGPDALELEVTETVFLERSWALISEKLTRLRNTGIRLALDDFGTGHASLSHLGQLTIDAVKMDKSFVASIGRDKRRELIARTITNLATGLEIECIAEGIETDHQLEFLSKLGCSTGQGFMLAKPMGVEDAIALVTTSRTLAKSVGKNLKARQARA